MIKLGIYCPDWILANYNTDHKIVKSFAVLEKFSNLEAEYVASSAYTLTTNIDRIVKRILKTNFSLVYHGIKRRNENIDVVYHYGEPENPNSFFKSINHIPSLVTAGFMTDNYMKDIFGHLPDRRKEADILAKKLDKASLIHFHTVGGRERFLSYRPDFESRTISIPFFLPNLISENENAEVNSLEDNGINILFVGYDGKRKGLNELLEVLTLLGSTYLRLHRVSITIISKEMPQTKLDFPIRWHSKLPHHEIIQLMHEATIFVLIPRQESYGLVIVEAMIARCAIITDDDETRKEIIGDTGIQVPFGSTTSITQALRKLIEDKEYCKKLGNLANIRAQARFLPQIVAKQYEDCFKSILR